MRPQLLAIDQEEDLERERFLASLQKDIDEVSKIIEMFDTDGWVLFAERCAQEEALSLERLRSMNVQGEDISYYRARAWFLGWLRGLPEEMHNTRTTLAETLREAP